jgi:branched-chain amino acid transport system substrate-binding protein
LNEKIVLFVGRLVYEKGVQVLVNAIPKVLEKINAKGGILGKKIEFITRDDQFKVDVGLALAKDLVFKEKVDVLMGTINSEISLAISDLAKTEKIPFFNR